VAGAHPRQPVRSAALVLLAVLALLAPAGFDFANRVPVHAGSPPGTSVPGPSDLAALLRSFPDVMTPARFRGSFGLPAGLDGAGQRIALVEIENGFDPAALDRFDTAFGLPAADVQVIDASIGTPPRRHAADETMLDVEWAHAIAPGATLGVIVWVVPGVQTGEAQLAQALAAFRPSVVSVSAVAAGPWALASARAGFSLGWAPIQRYPTFVSTGDGGQGLGLPALLPGVAAVGGVEASRGGGGWMPWSASGGGYADWVAPRPAWQTPNPGRWRGVPDVAWLAGSPGLATYVRGWVDMEGTSAATPEWAALWALADQVRAERGLPPLAAPAPAALYEVARRDPAAFVQPQGAPAGTWNPRTGLGMPEARTLVADLAALPAGCCRTAPGRFGYLPLMAALTLAGLGLYLLAAGTPGRRATAAGQAAWILGLLATGGSAYLQAGAGPHPDLPAIVLFLVAAACAGLPS
jgi:subtilisin family serine protease